MSAWNKGMNKLVAAKTPKIKSLEDVPSIAAYLRRIGAEPRSLRTAVVTEKRGKYWRDLAVITIDKSGKVMVPDAAYAPTESEAQAIALEVPQYRWPEVQKLPRLTSLPPELKGVGPESLFEFKDIEGNIVMLQQRVDLKGEKRYLPWTYWDDNEWRRMEPEGKLPLWGLDQLKDHQVVFIHEGAKAARAVREMVEGRTFDQQDKQKAHPWAEELAHAAHLGWIGGALSPYRTDWEALKRAGVKRAYIVSDNDAPGIAAVPAIAYHLRFPAFHVQFTNEWPASFDLADPFPKKMFSQLEGMTYYTGPAFRSCLHPATWATDVLPPQGRGRPGHVLRDHFKDMWAYVEEVDQFVCIEMPEIIRTEPVLNKMLAGFSHVANTTALMVKSYRGRSAKLCYRPDVKGRVVTDKTTSAINLHTPTLIKPVPGNPEPFLAFLRYLFPVPEERHQVERWVATLIAHPEVHMLYALLLVSETQGMGKTTLGARVIAPLVGLQNVAFPSEGEITDSQFNGWLANKRLIVVGEIYSGHSWKAYNKLKGMISDDNIQVNIKFMREYALENWGHFFVCSNSRRALKIEKTDRRWFYPTITEIPWPFDKFLAFNKWIESGGLGIIRTWAEGYGDYVRKGDEAPATGLKEELIEGSLSEAQQEVADLARAMVEEHRPLALGMKDVGAWVRDNVESKIFDSDLELRKTMKELGVKVHDRRLKVGGRMQYVIYTKELHDQLLRAGADEGEFNEGLRKAMIRADDIIARTM